MLTILFINVTVVTLAVLLHYEFLYRVTGWIPDARLAHRYRILIGVFVALIAHTVEIWLFALAYWLLHNSGGFGTLAGEISGSLMDCVYFSYTVFTTLGFGDIQPHGALRHLTGVEALTGFVLITWSASFLYHEMHRHWQPQMP